MADERHINAGDLEHIGALATGATLLGIGIAKRKSLAGIAMALMGAAFLARGAQGYKRLYKLVGVELPGKPVHLAKRALIIDESIVIDRTAKELYGFWRQLNNLPQCMGHLIAVQETSPTRSHWVAKAPAGTIVEWDAEVIRDDPNKIIAWRSLEGSDVDNAGSVQFEHNPGGGTRVTVKIRYNPPADVLGGKVAKLFGADPAKEIAEDLRRFKQRMEVQQLI